MNKLITSLTTMTVALAITAGGTLSVFAEVESPSTTPKYTEKREEMKNKKEEKIAAKCDVANSKIDLVTKRYENNSIRRTQVFSKVIERVTVLVDSLDKKGYDTSKVRAELKTLSELSQNIKSLIEKKIALFNEAKSLDCGNSNGEFKAKLQEAKSVNNDIQQAMIDIRVHYQTKLRPAILELKSQVKATPSPTEAD